MQNRLYCLFTIVVLSLISCNQNEEATETITESTETDPEVVLLDSTSYEILATKHYPTVENYHVLLKDTTTNEDSLQSFMDKFRQQHCNIRCMISLYDSESVKAFATKYPLSDEEYLEAVLKPI